MSDLFRKSSLEKLSSPEQLDRTLTITSPMSWIGLLGATLMVIATIVWAIFGTLPEVVSTTGIIVGPDGVNACFTSYTGEVENVEVSEGDTVKAGDTLLTVKGSDGNRYEVTAQMDGILTGILAEPGTMVWQGSEIARITPKDATRQVVVCYVSAFEESDLTEGMEVLIYPTSADSQKAGHMTGRIIAVDSYAASAANLPFVLGADNLMADMFTGSGPVVAVTCALTEDASTASGYYWSGSQGSQEVIDNGTVAAVKFITRESAPISKLFTIFDR